MPAEVIRPFGIDFSSMPDARSHLEVTPNKIQVLPPISHSLEKYRQQNIDASEAASGWEVPIPTIDPQLKFLYQSVWPDTPEDTLFDTYNPSNDFTDEFGNEYMAVRVESRDREDRTLSVIYRKVDENRWELMPAPYFKMQDPFVSRINGELVLGGVETFRKENDLQLGYRTVFYRGKNLEDIDPEKPFARGPAGMKDIRLVGLPNGKIGVYTRPQGEVGGRGQIGYTTINSLDELNAYSITDAPLIPLRFPEDEWGGVNEAIAQEDGTILVIGHRASMEKIGEEEIKHYFVWGFLHDPVKNTFRDLGILAERRDFPQGDAKRKGLEDIVIPGGFRNGQLMVGASDTRVVAKKIRLPLAA